MGDGISADVGLTQRQRDTLLVVAAYFASNNVAPTLAELRRGLGVAPTTNVSSYVQPLVDQGLLEQPLGRYARRSLSISQHALPLILELASQHEKQKEITDFVNSYMREI